MFDTYSPRGHTSGYVENGNIKESYDFQAGNQGLSFNSPSGIDVELIYDWGNGTLLVCMGGMQSGYYKTLCLPNRTRYDMASALQCSPGTACWAFMGFAAGTGDSGEYALHAYRPPCRRRHYHHRHGCRLLFSLLDMRPASVILTIRRMQ